MKGNGYSGDLVQVVLLQPIISVTLDKHSVTRIQTEAIWFSLKRIHIFEKATPWEMQLIFLLGLGTRREEGKRRIGILIHEKKFPGSTSIISLLSCTS